MSHSETCMTTFFPASSIPREEIRHFIKEHSLPQATPGLFYKQKQYLQNSAQILIWPYVLIVRAQDKV